MPITIAIAEDNSFALKACVDKVSLYPECKIVLKAFNGEELIDRITEHPVDLILMDIQMPGMGGIESTRLVKQKHPQIKILMLTTFDDDEHIFEAIMAGASGYLLKEENAETLHHAIYDTLSGGAAMSASIALKVLNLLRNPGQLQAQNTQDFGLTKREIELLEQLKNGLSYESIAANLYISYGTVRKHIENIYRKLQVNNKVEAIRKAGDNRLI
ncbi:MAG: response regulator transcription factor [Pyrinomonadaceae bacterium]|nr:response regulator transcription factor [Sphingobacteriaceae bacterium]